MGRYKDTKEKKQRNERNAIEQGREQQKNGEKGG